MLMMIPGTYNTVDDWSVVYAKMCFKYIAFIPSKIVIVYYRSTCDPFMFKLTF